VLNIHHSSQTFISIITGYARLFLVLTAHYIKHDSPSVSLLLLIIFAALDGVDGWAARKLGQCSAFGAWVYNSLNIRIISSSSLIILF